MPNLLLIAGNGRNVGKTFLACQIIKELAQKHKVIGLKISPHFHGFEKNNVCIETNDFIVLEEKQVNQKDSSLMLQAGAEKVYFVMARQENLKAAFHAIKTTLSGRAVVCESGGLHEFINPGIFLFVKNKKDKIIKTRLLNYAPEIVENNGRTQIFDNSRIAYVNNRFSIE